VVWISELQRTSAGVDVYGRIFNASGIAAGGEFAVNNAENSFCANPAVSGSPQGGFAVAWSQKDIVVRATPSNPYDPSGVHDPSAQAGATAFASVERSTNNWDVFVVLLDANGAAAVPPFRLNSYTLGDQFAPRISALGDRYLAVWTSLSQPDPNTSVLDQREGVFGQVITGDGGLVAAADVHVNTTTVNRQILPAVTADGAGRWLVVWSSLVSDAGSAGFGGFDLFAQQYLPSGGQ
jgi:hypothetical protein